MKFGPAVERARRRFGETKPGAAVLARRIARAAAHRRSLHSTCFIGVTGSSGKTTTKQLIAAVLRTQLRGTSSPGTGNSILVAASTIRRTAPADEFAVLEIGATKPGTVAAAAKLVQPHIAVVTSVGREHQKDLPGLEAVAAEKRALVEAATSCAVLNADDPLVVAMRDVARADVVTYGQGEDADVRATDVRGAWPERFAFTLVYGGRSMPVQTQLVGTHWVPTVLAAVAVGQRMGIPIETAVRAIEAFKPVPGRLSPVVRDGITFIRDDWKAPHWSIDRALDVVAAARAPRKVVVIGWISNYSEPASVVYARVVERALAVADEVVLAGTLAFSVALPFTDERLRRFPFVRDAARYLDASLREGDLVLLKGVTDHLQRIILMRETAVRCWRERCGVLVFCDSCALLRLPARPKPATADELTKWARL